jgi:HK97 family phage prohead protease
MKALLTGYATVWNRPSALYRAAPGSGGFPWRYIFEPGAFRESIRDGFIAAVWNHDVEQRIGGTRDHTLSVHEDNFGLAFELDPYGLSIEQLSEISSGRVRGMSIEWRAIEEHRDFCDDEILITVRRADLVHVSPVEKPAIRSTGIEILRLEDAGTSSRECFGSYGEHLVTASPQHLASYRSAIDRIAKDGIARLNALRRVRARAASIEAAA